jgi:aspartate kinase
MGHTTDILVDLARQITDRPAAREMDMLLSTGEQVSVALVAMAIQSLGHKAVSLTGAQIGIRTDSTHTKARIKSISTERMRRFLDDGYIVIAAGFQGIDEDLNITTLGRGGSDTTAVALAAVLRANECEIYTDVDGVYTTDPRVLPEARRVSQISYDEMLELASLGAGVMHNRSIEFAKKFDVPVHVRNAASDVTGTMIVAEPESAEQSVCGAALIKNEARVTLQNVPDRPGVSLAVFAAIAECRTTVDMIVQNIGEHGRADISFTVITDDLPLTLECVGKVIAQWPETKLTYDDNVSKVSVVGLGMARQTGIADRMFRELAAAGVNIQMITTSEIKISVLVARDDAVKALRAVHQAFALDRAPKNGDGDGAGHASSSTEEPVDIVRRLQSMEELTVDDIALDETQARVTISGVPDVPGVAADVFEEIARSKIFVDMIVQSYGHDGLAALSFTVPHESLTAASLVAGRLAKKFGCTGVSTSSRLAKLSVSGIGMRSHTEVAIRMFECLAEAGINVEMINTSEVRVNVVVAGEHGRKGLECLEKTFAQFQK